MNRVARLVGLVSLILLTGVSSWSPLRGDSPAQDKKEPTGRTWTYDEAGRALQKSPHDPYLQYLTLQLGRREGRNAQEYFRRQMMEQRMGRRERIDLFNTFTGALAVQESLQLDTMLETGDADEGPSLFRPAPRARTTAPVKDLVKAPIETPPAPQGHIAVASLDGPTIKSHPWEKMLAGRQPDVGVLANCVPEDFYLVEFKQAAKLTEALHTANLWGDHLLTQMLGTSDSQEGEKRLKRQLGIHGIPPVLFDTIGLQGIAFTGSDLYVGDGSDVTMLVLGKSIVGLRNAVEGLLQQGGDIKKESGTFEGVAFTYTFNADKSVHVYAADPRPDLHVRSNSKAGFQRVLQAIAGKAPRLGESKEFAYIRTLMPRGAAEEDGLIYLSDACIRRLVGPRVKLSQQRRLRAFNHLKMIEHAALLYRTENGRAPKSFEELAQANCAPGVFGKGRLACPSGGTYTLAPDGMSAVSSIYGRAGQLTPLLDIELKEVTRTEAGAYQEFLQEYNQYWRTFFDPIAVRVRVTPQECRLETIILPLIDNSIYTTLAHALGGPAVALDGQPVPDRAIHTISAHLNKQPVIELLQAHAPVARAAPGEGRQLYSPERALREIMIAMHNFHTDYEKLPARAIFSPDKKPLLSWRVQLLPYLEQDQLYKEFKQDEPWDSEHNKKLIARMPAIYRATPELTKAGKTRYVVPVGKGTAFPPDGSKVSLGEMTVKDGTSNTVTVLQANDEHAVVWTKPDDLEYDVNDPAKGVLKESNRIMAAFGDASIRRLSAAATPKQFANVFSYTDGETDMPESDVTGFSDAGPRGGDLIPRELFEFVDPKMALRLLKDGIGDQVTYHVLDSSFPFNAEVSGFFSTKSPLGDLGPMRFDLGETLMIGMLVQSLTHPACVMVPVKDAKVVDEFLDMLDRKFNEDWLHEMDDFLNTEQYKVKVGDKQVRVVAIKFLGLSLRICWCRLGDTLVIANQVHVLQELEAQLRSQAKRDAGGEAGHAMFRVRPEHWKAVLADYHLGWAENHRAACLVNQQRWASVARGYPELVNADGSYKPELMAKVHALYGVTGSCPDGGGYRLKEKGCSCEHHGSAAHPTQHLAPTEGSATAKTIRSFAGLRATLTFKEEGLHAVVTIDRK